MKSKKKFQLKINWLTGLGLFLGFFSLDQLAELFIIGYNANTNKIIWALFAFVTLIITCALIFKYLSNRKQLPKVNKQMVVRGLYHALGMLLLMALWSIALIPLKSFNLNGTSTNQSTLESISKANAISQLFIIIMTCIAAPIIEEFLFRYLIITPYKKGKSRIIATIFSAILFATVHMLVQYTSIHNSHQAIIALIQTLEYLTISTYLSIYYYKNNNIEQNMFIHGCYNTIICAFTLI